MQEDCRKVHTVNHMENQIHDLRSATYLLDKSGFILNIKRLSGDLFTITYGVYLESVITLSQTEIINLSKFIFRNSLLFNYDKTFEEVLVKFREKKYFYDTPKEFLLNHGFVTSETELKD